LEVIRISNNEIKTIPADLGGLTLLKTFDVNSNLLVAIPPEIGAITGLKEFNISLNREILECIHENAKKGVPVLLEYLRSEAYDEEFYKWQKANQNKPEEEEKEDDKKKKKKKFIKIPFKKDEDEKKGVKEVY